MPKRILAIDYGEKRIGLAVTDENARLALPYEVIENKNLKFVVDEIKKIVENEGADKIVVGLPKSLGGGEVDNKKLDEFVASLRVMNVKKVSDTQRDDGHGNSVGLEIILFDERMSSKAADKFKMKGDTKESGWRDKVSAAIILQDYLDSLNS
ncbi:MAG: Holliday junction resolvase RuvX [bacterium]